MNTKQGDQNIKKILNWIEQIEKHTEKGEASGLHTWMVHSGEQSYFVKETAVDLLDKIYKDLFRLYPGIVDHDVFNLLNNCLKAKLFNVADYGEAKINEEITNLKRDIIERECCMAVYGLEIEESFELGKMEFHPRSFENQAPPLSKKDAEGVENNKYSWSCITLKGTSLYLDTVIELYVKEHIGVLEFLYHYIEDNHPADTSLHTSSSLRGQETRMHLCRIKGGHFNNSVDHDNKFGISIDKNSLENLKKDKLFEKLSSVLKKQDALSGKILTAISFYHESVIEKNPGMQIVKSIIGLEALLQTGSDVNEARISANLAEKVAFLISEELETRLTVLRDIKDLYEIRSRVGHGSKYEHISEIEAIDARAYLGKSIAKFMDLYEEKEGFNCVKDIENWFVLNKMNNSSK